MINLEIWCKEFDDENPMANVIYEVVPRKFEKISLRTGGPYIDFVVTEIEYMMDQDRIETVPQVIVYVTKAVDCAVKNENSQERKDKVSGD